MEKRIYHIINPVKVNESSDLFIAQPITFESFKIAREYSRDLEIVQCTAHFAEDQAIIPDFLKKTKKLKRSVASLRNPNLTRKLPFIRDILNRVYRLSRPGDYIIYTNVDIALKPNFYEWIHNQIINDRDAFIINRRTISSAYTKPEELPLMFEDKGDDHPGYDCFIFKRELIRKMLLGNICVGAVYIGLALFLNLKLFSKNFKEFGDEHLTFHIGNDQVWRTADNNPYADHNKREFDKIKDKLNRKFDHIDEILDSAFPALKDNPISTEE